MSGAARNRGNNGGQPPYQQTPGAPYRYDGPGSGAGSSATGGAPIGSRRGSVIGSATGSQAGSQHGGTPTTSPRPPQSSVASFPSAAGSYGAPGAPMMTDPARDPQNRVWPTDVLKLMDLPPGVFAYDRQVSLKFLLVAFLAFRCSSPFVYACPGSGSPSPSPLSKQFCIACLTEVEHRLRSRFLPLCAILLFHPHSHDA